MLIMWPARPWTASLTASPSVGWACTLRATSWTVRSHCWASVSSGSSSVTSGPMRWPPSSSPYLPSLRSLTNRRVAQAVGLAVGGERELGDLHVEALLAGLRLGEAEARDLGLAVRRPRDHHVVELHGLRAGDGLRRDDAHGLGGVGEHQLGGHVADGEDVRHVRAATRRRRWRRGRSSIFFR